MKKIPAWLTIVLLLSLVLISKFIFFAKEENKGQAAAQKSGALAVNYYVIKSLPYENRIFAAGKTGAINEVDIQPEIAAKVLTIYFKEGEQVAKGEVLVKLNDADFQAQLLKVTTQLKLALQKLDRLKKLREINGVSQEEYDMQENEISVLKADEKFYQAQIAKTNITAPFGGIVGLKKVSEGAFVNTMSPVVSLVQLKPLFVEFSVPGKYAQEIRKGMPLTFELENDMGAQTYSATLYALEPKMDETTKTIRVRALYEGQKNLLPGTYVKVFMGIGEAGNKLMLPSQCVIPVLKGHKVFRYSAGVAVETPVKIGPRNDQKVVVLEGLNEGDTVVTTGLMALKKDSKLRLIQATE